jgi:hypothetical protein
MAVTGAHANLTAFMHEQSKQVEFLQAKFT